MRLKEHLVFSDLDEEFRGPSQFMRTWTRGSEV